MSVTAVDLFAGPGGWDVGLLALGIDPLGVEWDAAACLTRAAAGLRTKQADVYELDPADFAPCEMLIGSPPCPTFSNAGKGNGHEVIDVIHAALDDILAGKDTRATRRDEAYEILLPLLMAEEEAKAALQSREPDRAKVAERARRDAIASLLVVEPLRWLLILKPRFVALEQVPPVLGIWERYRTDLQEIGYACWTGILSAEQYGTPQTRARAILLADREADKLGCPPPTHQRYVPMPKERDHDTLFDPGPRERIVVRGEEHLEPWISMAEALGWGMVDRASYTVTSGGSSTGSPEPFAKSARNGMIQQDESGRFVAKVKTRAEGRDDADDFDPADAPSRAVVKSTRSWLAEGSDVALQNSNQENAAVRGLDEPAGTLYFGHRMNEVAFVKRERSGERSEEGFDPGEAPSQTLTSKARSWTVRTGDNSMSESRDTEDMVPYERSTDEPAPTLTPKAGGAWKVAPEGEHEDPPMRWKKGQEPTHYDRRQQQGKRREDGTRDEVRPVPADQPAPTITAVGLATGRDVWVSDQKADWPGHKPATTVAGDPRLSPRAHHDEGSQGKDAVSSEEVAEGGGSDATAVRISIEEASVLQGFPHNYPWQGSRTKQFEQVGNAVPPPLARAAVAHLVGA